MRQSAPTLLLTTVGLLLTGELLNHVSVGAELRGPENEVTSLF